MLILYVTEPRVCNRVDPDQTSRPEASDLGLSLFAKVPIMKRVITEIPLYPEERNGQ